MTTNEIIKLLENALDCEANSPSHSGYTAREIHRKCLLHIRELDQKIQLMNTDLPSTRTPYYLGWGKGKDE